MKKLLPIFALGLALTAYAKNEVYESPGEGKIYTLADLAKIEGSGVTREGNTYTLVKDINLIEKGELKDGLKIENNIVVRMGADVLVRVYGPAEFAVTDTATICPTEDGVEPKGFHLYGMNASNRTIQHVHFEGASLSLGNPEGTVIENCTFHKSNGKLTKYSISFSASSVNNAVRNCYFNKTGYSCVGNGSNVAAGMTIENNLMEDCSTAGRNYPYINCTPAGNNGTTTIRNNRIIGSGGLMAGALSMSNMLGMTGENKVVIENNEMSNCRYGMNIYGMQDTRIIGNKIINCHYEANANNGGSGITVYTSKATNVVNAYIERNYIDGSLWGVTVIGPANVNMGNVSVATSSPDYNPGGNVFKNNGNCGKAPEGAITAFDPSIPYDLYNNSTLTIYAQGNEWGGADQTTEEIEKRIYHKVDDPTLGEVIFLPAASSGVIDLVNDDTVKVITNSNGTFSVTGVGENTHVEVYNVAGTLLWSGKASSVIRTGHRGTVIVAVNGKGYRIAL